MITNDLIWWVPFTWYLFDCWPDFLAVSGLDSRKKLLSFRS
ncbi:hypothetical protein [Streptomyces sp. NBC_00343]|nr:hypothetical protein [Streptomyces sp. NBC_00343]